jgi:hypothetical protein
MPRAKKSAVSMSKAVAAVSASLDQLLAAIAAAAQSAGAAKGGLAKVAVKPAKGPGSRAGNPKYSKAQSGVWARYTPREREARIRKMLAARGVKRKSPAKKK